MTRTPRRAPSVWRACSCVSQRCGAGVTPCPLPSGFSNSGARRTRGQAFSALADGRVCAPTVCSESAGSGFVLVARGPRSATRGKGGKRSLQILNSEPQQHKENAGRVCCYLEGRQVAHHLCVPRLCPDWAPDPACMVGSGGGDWAVGILGPCVL